jgi:mono/diheme cytochrome c family protein
MTKLLTAMVAAVGLVSAAHAQEGGDAALGKTLAEANCSQCHNIAPGGAFKLYPPSFTAIAIYMDPDIIRMRILNPGHSVLMPEFHTYMMKSNLDALVAFIQSLEEM